MSPPPIAPAQPPSPPTLARTHTHARTHACLGRRLRAPHGSYLVLPGGDGSLSRKQSPLLSVEYSDDVLSLDGFASDGYADASLRGNKAVRAGTQHARKFSPLSALADAWDGVARATQAQKGVAVAAAGPGFGAGLYSRPPACVVPGFEAFCADPPARCDGGAPPLHRSLTDPSQACMLQLSMFEPLQQAAGAGAAARRDGDACSV